MEKDNNKENNNKDNNENVNNNSNKEEEDVTVGGYGYWKREGDLINNEKFKPTKIENLETLKNEDKKVSLGSAWNTAGTWEEKHYKKNQIEEFFNSNLDKKDFGSFIISGLSGYKGDVSFTIILLYIINLGLYCICKTKSKIGI